MGIEELVEELRGAREESEAGTNGVLVPNWSDKSVRNQRRSERVRHLAKHLPKRYLSNTAYKLVVRKGHPLYYINPK